MAARPLLTIVEPGTLVWVPAPKNHPDIYQQAKVLAIDESTATCRTEADSRLETIDLAASPPFLCNPTVEPDMTGLHHIHEAGILYNLEQRSIKSEPYTFLGSVLCAVNPLKPIANPINVGTRSVLMGGPHPYAVAEASFQQMTFQGARELQAIEKSQGGSLRKASQSIVIGGESGAGKTESSKMVLQHLVARQTKNSTGGGMNGLDERLLGTNPILEAFGNATTLRNPNSSRFGKMLRLHFDPPPTSQGTDEQWSLRGATVQSYLLERSRVTTHETGERGYHIMYYVIAGNKNKMSPTMEGLGLDAGAGAFRYTSPLHPKLDEKHDVKFVKELVDAMSAVGLSDSDAKGVFELVAAVIQMGNIEFAEKDTNEGPAAYVSNNKVSQQVAALLGVEEEPLNRIFTERRFEVAGKEIMTVRNARAAGFARDAVAKAVYSGLFDWIMRRIDVALGGSGSNPDMTSTIGVLDIFGFETFAINGFEQLLINYTNEALQGTFNSQIFIAEAALYQREGLFGTDNYMGQPLDNGICIELLQGNPNVKGMETGLLMTVDSEGKVPDPSDAKMLVRLHTNFGKHGCMIQPHPKDKASTFIIRHYAATVTYTVGTFLEKNNDRLPDDMERTLKASSKAVLREVFEIQDKTSAAPPPPAAAAAAAAKPGAAKPKAPPPARKPPARSIVHKFQGQIKQLVDDLEMTKCSFIRCVKPNAAMIRNDADPSWFDRRYVKKQLDALNIAQTAEVLRNGYPTRIEYSVLVDSYVNVFPERALRSWRASEVPGGGKDNKSFVRALFYAFGVETDIYKLGLTRVFFKGGKLAELDTIMKAATSGNLSDDVVKRFTYFYARVKWRRAAVLSRCQDRLVKLFQRARTRKEVAVKVQALIRMQPERRRFKQSKRGAVMAQKLFRGRQGRKLYRARLQEAMAEAKRRAEEARARQDADAIAAAEKYEREQREAMERREREELEAAAKIEAALEHQQEARVEEETIMQTRRATMMPGRQTTVAPTGKGVAIRPGGKLRPKPMMPKNALPPPPMFDESLLPPPPDDDDVPPPPEDALPPPPSATDKKKLNLRDKRGSFFEKLAQQQADDFKIPATGYTFVRFEKSRKSIALMSKLFSSKPQFKWERCYYMLDKPARSLTLFTDATKKKVYKNVAITPTTKVFKHTSDKQKPHAAQVTDTENEANSEFLAFETENLWKRFIKDVDDAVVGFRPTVPEPEGNEKKQVDLKVVAQLNLLLFRKQITQKEFDELFARAMADAEAAAEQVEEEKRENEAKLAEMNLEAITKPIALNVPYKDGRVTLGNPTLVRKIDHLTFEEVFMLGIEMRFFLTKYPEKVVGWSIAHKFTEFEALFMKLSDPQGELSSEARLKLPEFPKLNYGSFAKRINREHNEGLAKIVEDWVKKVWALVPATATQDIVDELLPPPPAPLDPSMDAANWRSVRDPDSGQLYWNNKVTGETRYEDPLETLGIKVGGADLEEGWEEILDPETNESYYYNNNTEETSWERPVKKPKEEKKKKLELKDLLRVEDFNTFFDLKGNVESLVEALGISGDKPAA